MPMRAAHPPAPDHLARDLGQLLDVGLGARRQVAVDDLLGRSAAERDLDLRAQLLLRVVEAVGVRGRERHAERHAARDDRDLAHRVGALGEHPDDRVAALVVRGAALVLVGHHHLALCAEHDLLERVGEVGLLHLLVAAPRGEQRRLVDEVREVGADHAGRRRGDRAQVDVVGERNPARVDVEDLRAPVLVGRLRRRPAGRTARAGAAPGRARRAGSSRAITITPVDASKPSISVRIWFSVCSRSSLPPLKPATPECASGRSRRARR